MTAAMEPVMTLVNKYRGELESTVESLRQRSAGLGGEAQQLAKTVQSQLHTTVESQLRDKQAAVQDLGPLPANIDYRFVLETYAWSAVLMLGLSVAQLFGAYLVGPLLLGVLFNTTTLVALTYVLLPAYFLVYHRKHSELTETDRRMLLLALALVLGLTSGYVLSGRVLHIVTPPAFLIPLIVGVSVQVGVLNATQRTRALQVLGPRLANDRRLFLAATVGLGGAAHVLFGLVTGQLGVTYLLLMAITAAVSAVSLQLFLADVAAGKADMIVSQLGGLVLALYIQLLISGVFGSSKYSDYVVAPPPTL